MTTVDTKRDAIHRALADGNGVLRLEPAWVARDFVPPGRRLGLPAAAYDARERGAICERWLASTTPADNRFSPGGEGLSWLALDTPERITLKETIAVDPAAIMGAEYAATHRGLGRLAKIFDYSTRLPFHLHLRQHHAALVGRHSKDEAYYIPPGVDLGLHPESFLGLHPSVAEESNHELLLPYLEDWNNDLILQHSVGYLQVAEHGFHIPSGVLHAPGSALTIELQEDSDVLTMLQALNAGRIISKELLWKDIRAEDRRTKGERFILELIDWEENGDPRFFDNHHLTPNLIEQSRQPGGEEYWIYYNTTKFSGKKLRVRPGHTYTSVDTGVHNVLVWAGSGTYGGLRVEGGDPQHDEVLITHDRAVAGVEITNTGSRDLLAIKFFGPDVNPHVPMIERH